MKAQLHSFSVFKDSIQDYKLCNYALMLTFGNTSTVINRTSTYFTKAATAVLQNLNLILLKMTCTPWAENRKKVNMHTSCFHLAFFFFLNPVYYARHKQKHTKDKMICTHLINAGKYQLWSHHFYWKAQFTIKCARQKEREKHRSDWNAKGKVYIT